MVASEEQSREQDQVLEVWQREREAAIYAAQRAQKQYDLADPENRLVTDELERRWNEALRHVQDVEQRIAQRSRQQATAARPTREDFESLGSDLKTLWNSPDTDVRLKKRIVRTLIHEVIADLDRVQGALLLTIHWKGGIHTELRLRHRRRGENSAQTSKDVVAAVRVLARVCSDELIAGVLTRSGLRTGRGNRWTKVHVTSLRSHHEIPRYTAERRQAGEWMTLTQAADCLGISGRTLRVAVERGEIEAEHPLAAGPWVLHRTVLETEAAARLVERVRRREPTTAIRPFDQASLDYSAT